MTTMIEIEQLDEKQANPLFVSARKLFLFGIGAVALAQDQMGDYTVKLVERGEKIQQERMEQFNHMLDERRKESRQATKKAEKEVEKRLEQLFHRLNIPTSDDIKALNSKITTLTRKVDELKKAATHPAVERVSKN